MNIDNNVRFKDGSYQGDKIRVASVNGERIQVARIDAKGREWRRYENKKDLEVVKDDDMRL